MEYRYGHFNPDSTELIVINPRTPRAVTSILWLGK
jgi:hypothetical protein